ncbi:heme-binding domain-containing protein [Pedobacter sp. PAMC26386]|nr:heme-binding domain-containing protein [Pedobacter sp. PAMC26386]
MKRVKTVLTAGLILLIAIQFIPVNSNQDVQIKATDLNRIYPVPLQVQAILKNSCYDCHSNYTRYPWYSNLQPISGWMASHINKGKKELNFSDLGSYPLRKQQSKLKAIINSIHDGTMPLVSYLFIHKKAELSETDKTLVINWIEKTKDSLSLLKKE